MNKKTPSSKKVPELLLPTQIPVKLLSEIKSIWEAAQTQAARSVNTAHVKANWLIGQQIVEAQQGGKRRAKYGDQLLNYLSENLTRDYGTGFSVSSLRYMRLFYQAYSNLLQIHHAVRDESVIAKTHPACAQFPVNWKPGNLHSSLSWHHYRVLLKVDVLDARNFYEIEAIRNNWSGRQLERQIDSLLFFRLLKSRNKKGLLALANKGNEISLPIDIIKDPFVLEFIDLPESHELTETKLETALISKLKDFLLELGSGFAYIGRQKRLTLEGDHFNSDLVFYHIKLKCYVIIDLKTEKLTPGDLGQMLIYVHYYDREIKTKAENPTIGLILCTDKNDAVAEYVLDEAQKQIFTSRYQYVLPTVDELQQQLRHEIALLQPLQTNGKIETRCKVVSKKKGKNP